jgi:hypothetical protein
MPSWSYVTGSRTAFSASIPIPVAGQPIYAQDVSEPVRVIADRTQFLSASKSNLSGSNWFVGNNYFTGSLIISGALSGTIKQTGRLEITGTLAQTSYAVTRSIAANKCFYTSPVGGNDLTSSLPSYRYTYASSSKYYFPLDDVIVDGCTLNGFAIGHNNSNAPATSASFCHCQLGSTLIVEDGTMATNTSTGNVYISLSGQNITVDRKSNMYYVYIDLGKFTGVGVSSAVFNMAVYYTVTSVGVPSG